MHVCPLTEILRNKMSGYASGGLISCKVFGNDRLLITQNPTLSHSIRYQGPFPSGDPFRPDQQNRKAISSHEMQYPRIQKKMNPGGKIPRCGKSVRIKKALNPVRLQKQRMAKMEACEACAKSSFIYRRKIWRFGSKKAWKWGRRYSKLIYRCIDFKLQNVNKCKIKLI